MKTMSRLSAAERRQQNVGSRTSAAERRRCDRDVNFWFEIEDFAKISTPVKSERQMIETFPFIWIFGYVHVITLI